MPGATANTLQLLGHRTRLVARNYITNKDIYLPLGTTANKQGRVAGENAAGGNVEFKGVAGSVITKTFDCFACREDRS